VEEEEEPKEGEEPKAEVTSVVFLDISVVLPFFKCVINMKRAFTLIRAIQTRQKRLKLRSIGTGN